MPHSSILNLLTWWKMFAFAFSALSYAETPWPGNSRIRFQTFPLWSNLMQLWVSKSLSWHIRQQLFSFFSSLMSLTPFSCIILCLSLSLPHLSGHQMNQPSPCIPIHCSAIAFCNSANRLSLWCSHSWSYPSMSLLHKTLSIFISMTCTFWSLFFPQYHCF